MGTGNSISGVESEFDSSESDSVSMVWMDLEKFGNLFSHQGSNLYLRIGALCTYDIM